MKSLSNDCAKIPQIVALESTSDNVATVLNSFLFLKLTRSGKVKANVDVSELNGSKFLHVPWFEFFYPMLSSARA